MGRASINTCDQGRASILYQREQHFLLQAIAKIEDQLAFYDAQIVQAEADILDAENALADAIALIDAQVSGYAACVAQYGPEPSKDATPKPPPWPCAGMATAIEDAQKAQAKASATLYERKQALLDMKAQKKAVDDLHVLYIAERDKPDLMEVWVADWTIDDENPPPASVTGTIEVWGMFEGPGDVAYPQAKVILCPQYTPAERPYKATEDFGVTGPMNSEAAMVFSHIATWAWVQEHRPRYITAEILALSQATQLATVVRTTPVGLDAIQGVTAWTKAGVPFHYRDCGSRAFRVGDRVIVEFSGPNKANPRIIGFEDNPRPCDVNPPIVLWDDTANNYIKLEYLDDLGSGLPGWLRTNHGNSPICGSFQWRRMSDGVFISVVASTLNGSLSDGAIFQDEAFLDAGPSGKVCTGAALRSSGHLVAFCIDAAANHVSLWIKPPSGSWTQMFGRNGVHTVDYQGAIFNQDCSQCYAFWTQDDQPTVGAWLISISWGETISVSGVSAVDDSYREDVDVRAGNWDDGYNGAPGFKNISGTDTTVIPRLIMAYSPEDGSVVSVGVSGERIFSGRATGTWTDPPPGSYRFEQDGEADTTETWTLSGSGLSADFTAGGRSEQHTVTASPPVSESWETLEGHSSATGTMAAAIASVGITNPFVTYISGFISPLHFGGALLVQAYETDGSAMPQGFLVLIGADGSVLGSTPESDALYSPELAPVLTRNNQPYDEWADTTTSKTAYIPNCQPVFKWVAETPSGQYVAMAGNGAGDGVCVISNADVATLLPEWAQGHTLYIIGFSKGWRGKGIPWPS